MNILDSAQSGRWQDFIKMRKRKSAANGNKRLCSQLQLRDKASHNSSICDFDICTLRPNLRSLLAIPSERNDPLTHRQLRNFNLVYNCKVHNLSTRFDIASHIVSTGKVAACTSIGGSIPPETRNWGLKLRNFATSITT